MITEDPMIMKSVSITDAEQPAGTALPHEREPLVEPEMHREKTLDVPTDDSNKSPQIEYTADVTTEHDNIPPIENTPVSAETAGDANKNMDVAQESNSHEHETIPRDETPMKNELSDGVLAIDGDDSSGQAVDDAEEKRRLELESMIAEGRYAVPIGQGARRRQRTAIVGIFLILLMFVALDVLLDAGIIDLPFIPHTSFFR